MLFTAQHSSRSLQNLLLCYKRIRFVHYCCAFTVTCAFWVPRNLKCSGLLRVLRLVNVVKMAVQKLNLSCLTYRYKQLHCIWIWQSAYKQGHSTETALLDVLHSSHTAADNKEVTLLIGFDLSAAFDTVCHSTLTKRLHTEFGVSGTVLSWIHSECLGLCFVGFSLICRTRHSSWS